MEWKYTALCLSTNSLFPQKLDPILDLLFSEPGKAEAHVLLKCVRRVERHALAVAPRHLALGGNPDEVASLRINRFQAYSAECITEYLALVTKDLADALDVLLERAGGDEVCEAGGGEDHRVVARVDESDPCHRLEQARVSMRPSDLHAGPAAVVLRMLEYGMMDVS